MDCDDVDNLPPPPPAIPDGVVPIKVEQPLPKEPKVKRTLMARPGTGKKGQPIQLLTNHFKVGIQKFDVQFFHYSVVIKYEDGNPLEGKGVGRKVFDKLQQTYGSELGNKDMAYDGEKSLFTIGALPRNVNEFTVVLEDGSNRCPRNGSPGGNDSPGENDKKRLRAASRTKAYIVELTFAAEVPMQAIGMALKGQESENSQEALRVLDIILRQNAAKQGCLLVKQSFFHDDPSLFVDLGGGIGGLRGFHSSFRTSQGNCLSLNMDVSTTMIVTPGPLIDFLIASQNARDPFQIDWPKAKRMIKNLRVKVNTTNQELKIVGLSDLPCNRQIFTLRRRNNQDDNADSEFHSEEITVADYYSRFRKIDLRFSADLPCINVGRLKRPTYIPVELCTLVPLQRYTKALTIHQRTSLVEKSRQKPQERMTVLREALRHNNYDAEPMLRSLGISVSKEFTQVNGRVLQAPKLKLGNGEELFPRNGRWNLNNKKFFNPTTVVSWAIVNFSARCNTQNLVRDLCRCGNMKGIRVEEPIVIEESPATRRNPPGVRVDEMFQRMKEELPGPPKFLLCLLSERKNCDIYGPWKRKCLSVFGIINQCICPIRVNDNYLGNVLLKINAKLGGINSLLQLEESRSLPIVSKAPTIILGMDVSHGSPGQSDVPSIAAVVSSREWPGITKYRASVRTQSPKVEMIDSLFKPVSDTEDQGIIRELMLDFYQSSGKRKPDQVIIFRDGVSESQFTQVLNIELDQIFEACKFLDDQWKPKITLIVAQKNHHTKFFLPKSPDNVPPGTVVDDAICHPRNFDFYMCAQAGMIGTTRPTHYHVLHDENRFAPDDLQELVHSLSYVYQRSTTAISMVAPVRYAHLAATLLSQFLKFDDRSETSSSHGGVTSAGSVSVPELPKLHQNVSSSMFFC